MLASGRSKAVKGALTQRASVREAFAEPARSRGDRYFERRLVLGATAQPPSGVRADVMGSSMYEVSVRLDEAAGELRVFCSCPVGAKYDDPCKHLWAVLREIDSRDLLPASRRVERLRVRLVYESMAGDEADAEDGYDQPDYTEDDADDGLLADPRLQVPRAVLETLLDRRGAGPERAASSAVDLFALLHTDAWAGENLRLSLLTPKGGGFRAVNRREVLSHARPGTLAGDLALLLLQGELGSPYFRGGDASWLSAGTCEVSLPWSETAGVLQRLASEARLLRLTSRNAVALIPSHPELVRLSLSVLVDRAEAAYRVAPRVLVGTGEVSLDAIEFVHGSGVVLLGSALARTGSSAEAEWLMTLQRADARDLLLAADELESFLERYYGEADLPEVTFPEGLELAIRDLAPERWVDVATNDVSGQGVALNVTLRYENKQVPLLPLRPWAVDLSGGARYPRDSEWEGALLAELEQLGVRRHSVSAGGQALRIGTKRVQELVSALLGTGWRVSMQRKAYRRIDGFRLRAASGIDWLEISGTFELAGQELPLGELLRALERRRRSSELVELADGTVVVGADELLARVERLLDLGASLEPGEGSLRLRPAHVGAATALLDGATSSEQDPGFTQLRQALDRGLVPEAALPPRGFRGTLREYQREGLGWLRWLEEVNFGGCLADDMGLGKTVQVLALLLGRGRRHGPSLVVAPRSVLHNWASEALRFAPALDPIVHWGPERVASADRLQGSRLVITTYAILARDIELLSEVQWDYLVVDEAQAIKNPSTQSAKLVRKLAAKHRLALTGTPIENHLDELWALLDFLNPGFGSRAPFTSASLTKSESSLIRALVRPFILRRTKHTVAKDLPERVEQTLEVELSRSERRRYDELARKLQRQYAAAVSELGAQRSTPVLLTGLLRLRQAACHQGLLDDNQKQQRSSKLAVLMDRVNELREEGAKCLVFSQFTEHLDLVEKELSVEGISFVRLDGKTRRRAERVKTFQEDASVTVFLISLKAGGVGLNLTAAEYVFLLDPWWNPAVEAQAIDRAHRIGQTSRVIAYRLIAAGTVEQKVALLQQRKRDLVDSVFGDEQAFLGKLSQEDLAALLQG